jgi:hypothetical protein
LAVKGVGHAVEVDDAQRVAGLDGQGGGHESALGDLDHVGRREGGRGGQEGRQRHREREERAGRECGHDRLRVYVT